MNLPRICPRWVGLLLPAAAVVVAVSLAFADDESDRRGYLSDIENKLGYTASELSGVKSDSGDGRIRNAERYVDEVRDLVNRLSGVKGDDSKAREVVDRYPGYIEKFKRATEALRSMKNSQRSVLPVIKSCEEKDKELVAQAEEFANKNDPEGLDKLPRIASDYKNMSTRFLEEADRFGSQMDDWRRAVQYFDASDNKWSDVRRALHEQADGIQGVWKNDRRDAENACTRLKAGPDHPVVRDVLSKLANSSAGRKEVMENLNRLINETAAKIKDVPGASGAYAVDNVREKLDAIDSTLQILERTKGADPKAKDIAEKWPAIAREARASIAPFKELKEHHHALDELPGKCNEMNSKLDSFISANGDDSDGIDKIPTFAAELGNPVIIGMAKAKERLEKMKSARENVQRFTRSDGPWAEVMSAYRSSSSTIFDFFEDRYEETEAACRDIVKTQEHPKVKAALDRLRGRAGSDSDQLERDVADWVGRARATYTLDCNGMQQIWQAFCAEDWEPGDTDAERNAKATADGLRGSMRSSIDAVLGQLPSLEARAQLLVAKKETKSRGTKLQGELTKQRSRLEKLSRNPALGGNYNVMTQYANTYGKQAHARLWSSYGCDVPLGSDKEAEFPVSDKHRKPDCIIASKCEVWEFKADSPGGHKEGEAQKSSYRRIVPAYYTDKHRRGVPADSHLGGASIMKALEKQCLKGDEIVLRTDVYYYDQCKSQYECVSGD